MCLEPLAEAGTSWDEFNVRRQCIPGTWLSDGKGFVSYMKPSTWNDEVAANVGPKPGVVTAPDEFWQVLWSSAMIDVKHSSTQFKLNGAASVQNRLYPSWNWYSIQRPCKDARLSWHGGGDIPRSYICEKGSPISEITKQVARQASTKRKYYLCNSTILLFSC